MSFSAAELRPLARDVEISEEELRITLTDGRRLSVPLVWFPRLLNASPKERQQWELLGNGEGIHWPAADEDLSVVGLLAGNPGPTSQ